MAIERDPGTENLIGELEQQKRDIYRFMREEYEKATNYIDTYDAEVHDPRIAAIVSREFNISAEEARNIYGSVEAQIADFHKNRLEEK